MWSVRFLLIKSLFGCRIMFINAKGSNMDKYISEFVKKGTNDENYVGSEKTYFPPWWKFWNRKIKTEKTTSGDMMRVFDIDGNIIQIKQQRSTLHPRGFGSKYYWETLDLKTMTATSEPYTDMTRKVYPDGRCEEVYELQENGVQKVVLGRVDRSGNNIPYARLMLKHGKQIACQWVKRNIPNATFLKQVIKAYPFSLEEKEALLKKASEEFRNGKEIPEGEEELREFKNEEEKARLKARKESLRPVIAQEKYNDFVRRRRARRG